ncbi:hypothetical protein [Thermincola ferriacetica]|uniref:hypothetical protein n=1 Tax=Thermincola ferriacetica TaxID=281456 RepID=UPI00128C383E|nr:hypothetical protein [Thermincola ferriacetica]
MDSVDKKVDGLDKKVDSLEKRFDGLDKRVDNLEKKLMTVLKVSIRNLDLIYAQVAYNTEQEVKINEIAARVDQLETDVKLIKKLVSNQ